MERKYFLKSERVGFSIWTNEDLPLAKLLWGNPDVTKYICASGRFSDDDIIKRLNQEISNYTNFKIQYWPIFLLSTNEFIGCCGLRPYANDELEIGFHLLPKFWRQGLAQETAKAVIGYAFNVLKTKKLFAGHNPKNTISSFVLKSIGFNYVRDEYYEPTGLNHPSYELLSPNTN